MIPTEVITLQGTLLPSGEIALWGLLEDGRQCPMESFRKLLLAWHRRSYYGTMADTFEYDGRKTLLLSPLTALDYFAAPSPSLYGTLVWGFELQLIERAAAMYMLALQHGWYAPSFEARRAGKMDWELLLPEHIAPAYQELMEQAAKLGFPDLRRWFHAALHELQREHPAVKQTLDELQATYAMLRPPHPAADEFDPNAAEAWFDKDDWLEAIGWQQDEAPFRTCLQLVEPEAEESWRLQLLLQDLTDTQLLIEFNRDGEPKMGFVPPHWNSHLQRKLAKDTAKCLRILPWLSDDTAPSRLTIELTGDQAWDFMDEGSLRLMEAGVSVMLPSWWEELRLLRPKVKAHIRSSVGSRGESAVGLNQILQFDWKVAVGDIDLTEEEFTRMAAEKKRLMFIRGKWIQLDPALLEQIRELMKQNQQANGLSLRDVLELHLLEGDQPVESERRQDEPDSLGKLQIEVELNKHLKGFMSRLLHNTSVPQLDTPAGLQAQLRRYQQEGVSWLHFLRTYGLGGCLADDMGLGKTIQFIAYLLHARRERAAAPALLICPTSVLGNWQKELERFAPGLRVYLHYGPQRAAGESFAEAVASVDLVVTSYQLSHLDQEELSSVSWDAVCLDEAQNIKNVYTKQAAAIRRLKAGHRIALTGTPIENRLTELWSIIDFTNPGYLGSLREFTHRYANAIEKTNDAALTGQVQKLVRPFLLRRLKKDPAIQLDLPEKYESKTYVSLTVEQGALYENVVQRLMEQIETLTGMERRGLILATLMKLKQICDHPALFLKEKNGTLGIDRSGKIVRLLEMLGELREEGDNCLIFTQFIEMGHILQSVIGRELGEPAQFLHGGLNKNQRDALIERFQAPGEEAEERFGIFILSLRAGGTGLNLTAANHVFHFDRWWNPAVENQATDRAFRIGQTRDVQVHKFVTLGTLEERIDEMLERKQGLSEQIVGGGENWVTEMSTTELRELFALRREWIGK